MALAIYAGTFDPVTHGHVDVLRRARALFDELEVAVAADPGRDTLFATEERVELFEAVLSEGPVPVRPFRGLLVEYAAERGAQVLVRGLRRTSDFDPEYQMAVANRRMEEDLETVFLMTSPDYGHVSSTLVREIYRHGGDLEPFVPEAVRRRLETHRNAS